MSDHNHTYVRETERTGGNGGLAFIVGGVVVAVAFVLWLVFGTGMVATGPAAGTGAGDTNTSVTIEAPAAAQAPAPEAAPAAPEAAPAAPAPGN